MENVISLQAIRHLKSPQHRRSQYDHCTITLINCGIALQSLKGYIEREQMEDGHMKSKVLEALDVIAEAYNYSKLELERVTQVC